MFLRRVNCARELCASEMIGSRIWWSCSRGSILQNFANFEIDERKRGTEDDCKQKLYVPISNIFFFLHFLRMNFAKFCQFSNRANEWQTKKKNRRWFYLYRLNSREKPNNKIIFAVSLPREKKNYTFLSRIPSFSSTFCFLNELCKILPIFKSSKREEQKMIANKNCNRMLLFLD